MIKLHLPMLALAVVFSAGCKKDEPTQTTTTTSATVAATTTASAAPKKGECQTGYTKVEQMGFCIKLPAGYTADPPKKGDDPKEPFSVDFEKNGDKADGFTCRVSTDTLASVKDDNSYFVDAKKKDVKETGDLLGGKGWFFYSSEKGKEGGTIGVYVQGPKYVVVCEQAGNGSATSFKTALDIMKTIMPLEGG